MTGDLLPQSVSPNWRLPGDTGPPVLQFPRVEVFPEKSRHPHLGFRGQRFRERGRERGPPCGVKTVPIEGRLIDDPFRRRVTKRVAIRKQVALSKT